MRSKALVFILLSLQWLLSPAAERSPDTLSLHACFTSCDSLLPFAARIQAYNLIYTNQAAILESAHLPSFNLNASASYQSDVVTLPINIPGLNIPSPAHDQYGIYTEVRQSIYDAGIGKARLVQEDVNRSLALNEVEQSREKMHRSIADAWFGLLLLRQQKGILHSAGNDLLTTHKRISAGVEEGSVNQSALWQVESALAGYRQQEIELATRETQLMLALELLTGFQIDTSTQLLSDPGWVLISTDQEPRVFRTAEFQAFELRQMQLEAGLGLVRTRRMPMISAWARAGYGRPGLNMLSDEFNPYFIGGASLSWEIWDWKRTSREAEIIALRKADLQAGRDIFLTGQEIRRQQLLAEIESYPGLIREAIEEIELREKINAASEAALEEGNISSSDYLRDYNELFRARSRLSVLQSRQASAFVDYALLTGISF